jgi:hypothetical protein
MTCAACGAPEIVLITISVAHVFVAGHPPEFDADRNQSDVLRRFGWESRSALKQQKFSAGIGTLVTVMHLAQYFGIGCFC